MKETERIYYYPGNNFFRIIDPVVTRNFIGQETNEIWSGKQKFVVTAGWMAVGITYEELAAEPEVQRPVPASTEDPKSQRWVKCLQCNEKYLSPLYNKCPYVHEELPDPDPTECDSFDRPRPYSDDMDDIPF